MKKVNENTKIKIKNILKSIDNDIFNEELNIYDTNCGMTNKSYCIELKNGTKYFLRLPGLGTEKLVNRLKEKEVYDSLKKSNLNISDEVLYFNINGIKLTKYINHRKATFADISTCMKSLKKLHDADIQEGRYFNLKSEILYYEKLMKKSKYKDYEDIKEKVFALLDIVDKQPKRTCLCHIDPNVDNFCIVDNNEAKLVDWEYASLQDPMLDLAMYIIYSNLNDEDIQRVISTYFGISYDNIPEETIQKIYIYCAAAGLLWSNWCEYKKSLGIDFGEYALNQYNFAKTISDYYYKNNVISEINKAIILAAGKGTRLSELTKDTHKALLLINDKPIIEYTIESLIKKNICDITIVVGYRFSDFKYLVKKYQKEANIKFVYNEHYNVMNNVYSIGLALEHATIDNYVILDADQLIQPSAIRKYISYSGYSTYYSIEHNNEWQPIVKNSKIVNYLVSNTTTGQYIRSLSYWRCYDIVKLLEFCMKEISDYNLNIYWDEIPLRLYNDAFTLWTYNIKKDDIFEVDTIDDYNNAKEKLKERLK